MFFADEFIIIISEHLFVVEPCNAVIKHGLNWFELQSQFFQLA
jgi:hypothetical protein